MRMANVQKRHLFLHNARSSFESDGIHRSRALATDDMAIREFGGTQSRSGTPPLTIHSVHFTGEESQFFRLAARRRRQSRKRVSGSLNTTPRVTDDEVKRCRPRVRSHEICGFRTHKSEVNIVVVRGVKEVNGETLPPPLTWRRPASMLLVAHVRWSRKPSIGTCALSIFNCPRT